LWKADEFSVDSESEFNDSDLVVKFLSAGEHCGSSNDEDNVND
jgi:hypothetical protein